MLINKIIEVCLKIVGLWPYCYNYVGPIMLLSTLITTLPFQCWKAYKLINDPILLMDSLSDILAEVLIFIKLFVMWISKSNIKNLIREIIEDWDRNKIPDEWKMLSRYCKIFCTVDLAVYVIAVVLYYPELITSYLTKPVEERQLLFQSHYPFDYRVTPNFEILNLIQIIQGYLMISVDTLTKSLLVAYVLHATAHIHLLKCNIKDYSDSCIEAYDKNDERISRNLKLIISEHLNILMLVQKIEAAYSYVSLFQIIFSSAIICVTGFVIITALQSTNILLIFKFVSFIVAMSSQAFTFCIAGQYLRDKGESIIHLLYNCIWYNTKPNRIKTVSFIISNAQNPLTLSGGKLFELSIYSFTQILKTSFSYLSVLFAVYS